MALKIIALVTQKGGCGKTTLAVNLATVAWQGGARVIILDADPQQSAVAWYESRDAEGSDLVEVRGGEIARGIEAAKGKGYELAFIDTPARAEPVNAEAARLSDFCVIPCQPSLVDMRAQKVTVDSLQSLDRKGAFVLTRVPPRGPRAMEAERGLAVFSVAVSPVLIGNRAAYPDAYGVGKGVTEYEKDGKAAQEIKDLWKWLTKRINR